MLWKFNKMQGVVLGSSSNWDNKIENNNNNNNIYQKEMFSLSTIAIIKRMVRQ